MFINKRIFFILLALFAFANCYASGLSPYQLYQQYKARAKEDGNQFTKVAVLGVVEKNLPSARAVSTFSQDNKFFFSSSSQTEYAKALKKNPLVSLTYLYITPKSAESIVIYGVAHIVKQTKMQKPDKGVYWNRYLITPNYYKFVKSVKLNNKQKAVYHKQQHIAHLVNYKLVNSQWSLVHKKIYP